MHVVYRLNTLTTSTSPYRSFVQQCLPTTIARVVSGLNVASLAHSQRQHEAPVFDHPVYGLPDVNIAIPSTGDFDSDGDGDLDLLDHAGDKVRKQVIKMRVSIPIFSPYVDDKLFYHISSNIFLLNDRCHLS